MAALPEQLLGRLALLAHSAAVVEAVMLAMLLELLLVALAETADMVLAEAVAVAPLMALTQEKAVMAAMVLSASTLGKG